MTVSDEKLLNESFPYGSEALEYLKNCYMHGLYNIHLFFRCITNNHSSNNVYIKYLKAFQKHLLCAIRWKVDPKINWKRFSKTLRHIFVIFCVKYIPQIWDAPIGHFFSIIWAHHYVSPTILDLRSMPMLLSSCP